MANIINFYNHKDQRGSLTVIEKLVSFQIKRVFYIYGVDDSKRGFHKHKKTIQLATCVKGSCDIIVENLNKELVKFNLDSPNKGLLLKPEDYHWMENFTEGTVLLVLASEFYDENDYIYEN
tara:strand:- start:159 stop:521 length:363 start_codon:yes stop_codon:yes gene_type:complete